MKKSIAALTLGAVAMALNPTMGESPYFSVGEKRERIKPPLTTKQKKIRAKAKASRKQNNKNKKR